MIYYFSYENKRPTGGNKKAYHHVDILNKHGFSAKVLHSSPGFRYREFDNQTQIAYTPGLSLTDKDFLVLPEDFHQPFENVAPGIRKVIFNQNSYYIFRRDEPPKSSGQNVLKFNSEDIVAAICVSENNLQYFRYCFPTIPCYRVRISVDSIKFRAGVKSKAIAFATRKHPDEISQVLRILSCRSALEGYELRVIEGMTEAEVAMQLGGAAFYLAFGYPEGCPLSIMEAMSSGCIVIGYSGFGGDELFQNKYAFQIPDADVMAFARGAESLLNEYRIDPEKYAAWHAGASDFIRLKYSREVEEDDVIRCWSDIGGIT